MKLTKELIAAIEALLDEAEDTVDLNSNDRGTSSRISSNTILELEQAFRRAKAITDEEIEKLREQASQSGDVAGIWLAERALSGDPEARRDIARIARAIEDDR